MATTMPDILKTPEVMAALRVKNPATLVGLRGQLRAFRVGRHWRYPAAAVAAYASGERPAEKVEAQPAPVLPEWAQGVPQRLVRSVPKTRA